MDELLERLWCSTWNRRTWSFRAAPIVEALRQINEELAAGREPEEMIVAVTGSLEAANGCSLLIKRLLKGSRLGAPAEKTGEPRS